MSRHSGPEYTAPSEMRCEAFVKGMRATWEWMRLDHRCPRTANQMRAGHAVCHQHARMRNVTYWEEKKS